MKSFVICRQRTKDTPWGIDSLETDQAEAERQANQLVTKPYMEHSAAVYEVGGTTRKPIFFEVSVVTRQEKAEQ